MKKTLLMSALVVTATTFAAATGNFKVETEHKAETGKKFAQLLSDTSHEVKLSTEVKLGESGVTLGGDVKMDKALFGANHTLKELNANAKYDFTTGVEGLKAHVKGNVGAENISSEATEVKVKGEAKVSYEKNGFTTSFMSDTTSKIETAAPAETKFTSNQEVKVEGKKDMLKDVLLRAKVSHDYDLKETGKLAFELEGKGGIEIAKDLTLSARDIFVVNLKDQTYDVKDHTKKTLDSDSKVLFTLGKKDLANEFELKLSYDKPTYSASAKGITAIVKKEAVKHFGFGFELEGKYTGVKNLELSGKGLFAGVTTDLSDVKANPIKGLVKLESKAKYDAKVNDKLTLTPSLELGLKFAEITKTTSKVAFNIKPAFDTTFQASKEVKLTSGFEADVKFAGSTVANFDYSKTDLKAKLGLEYNF